MSHIRLRPIIFITAAFYVFQYLFRQSNGPNSQGCLVTDAHSGQIFYEKVSMSRCRLPAYPN